MKVRHPDGREREAKDVAEFFRVYGPAGFAPVEDRPAALADETGTEDLELTPTTEPGDGTFETDSDSEIPGVVAETVDLSALTRAELDARAAELGIESPETLPNKAAVIAAIEEVLTRPNEDGARSDDE